MLSPRAWRRTRMLTGRLVAGTAAAAAVVLTCAPTASASTVPGSAPRRLGGHVLAASAPVRLAAASGSSRGPTGVDARSAALADASTGRQLWSRRLSVREPIGSITKVMTAILVIQAGHLGQEIKVTRAAVAYVRRTGASSAGLIAGDMLTAHQLVEAMLVPSGCDAAYLLATAYGPGRPAFVRKMNEMARTMGLASTHFSTFDGMPFPNEHSTYSTPLDLIRLGEQAMHYPQFRQIVAQRRYLLGVSRLHHSYAWPTTNKLLGSYRGAIGIKTGTTKGAGDCLLFEARRGSRTLIGVVLHANPTNSISSRFTAARRLLNWGFSRI